MPDPVIAVTSGEPAGIGPDIVTAINPERFAARLVVIGDLDMLKARARALGSKIRFRHYEPDATVQSAIEVINIPLKNTAEAGTLNPANAQYVLELLQRACQGCLTEEFDAMVTAPVHKEIINRAGVAFTGHTEYLADMCHAKPLMLLTSESLRVALVTTHLPLREIADAINAELISEIANILDQDLSRHFGIRNPHIKVCGLNPHAGENGVLGREEIEVIIPAINALKAAGLNISGPYPADTLFTANMLFDADAVLAMYHDQGLPVLKYSGFHNAVNTTLGLPIVRTSVDHGTALELAGKGQANPDSLFAAIDSAILQAGCMRDAR
ncbi:MAG: 4-hydroxythreonine-4-phosphate dehydrogenase PdxA [Pseudomonadota bacterium]